MQRYTAAVPVLSAVRQLEYESGSAMMASNSWQSHQTDCASWPRSASMHCTVRPARTRTFQVATCR